MNHLAFIIRFNQGEILKLFTANLKMNDANLIIEILQALGNLLRLDKAVPL